MSEIRPSLSAAFALLQQCWNTGGALYIPALTAMPSRRATETVHSRPRKNGFIIPALFGKPKKPVIIPALPVAKKLVIPALPIQNYTVPALPVKTASSSSASEAPSSPVHPNGRMIRMPLPVAADSPPRKAIPSLPVATDQQDRDRPPVPLQQGELNIKRSDGILFLVSMQQEISCLFSARLYSPEKSTAYWFVGCHRGRSIGSLD